MKNKVFFGSLVVLFFMGMVGGNYVSRTALSSTEKRYAVDVVENKTGKKALPPQNETQEKHSC